MKIFVLLRNLVSYFIAILFILIYLVPTIIIACLPERYRRDNKFFYFWSYLFYKIILWASFLPYKVKGIENLPKEAAILVGNHLSSLDIPVIGELCKGYPHIWLVLKFYEDTPFLGFFVKRMNVSVDQSNPSKAARSVIKILRLLQNKKQHLIIFPEGGRSRDNKIHEFFEGFAIIAQKTGRPVIPIYMPNNGRIYPPDGFLIHYYPIEVIIGKPLFIQENESSQDFTKRVRSWFIDQQEKKEIIN